MERRETCENREIKNKKLDKNKREKHKSRNKNYILIILHETKKLSHSSLRDKNLYF